MRLFRRHGDGARPPVVDEGAQGLFGVLPRQQGYAGQILFPFQLMQAAAQLRIGPPGAARGHEPQIDGILQAAYALAGIVAAAGIDVSIHAASIARRARQKKAAGLQRFRRAGGAAAGLHARMTVRAEADAARHMIAGGDDAARLLHDCRAGACPRSSPPVRRARPWR